LKAISETGRPNKLTSTLESLHELKKQGTSDLASYWIFRKDGNLKDPIGREGPLATFLEITFSKFVSQSPLADILACLVSPFHLDTMLTKIIRESLFLADEASS
jgi:hypothetical protein